MEIGHHHDVVDQENLDRNWQAAQSVTFGVLLVPAAQQLLRFLAQVDCHRCLYAGPAVSLAIKRYENCWLPLRAEFSERQLRPPLDCAWIWHVHRLNPIVYARDCDLLFGRLLDDPPQLYTDASQSNEALETTKALWQQRFPNESFEPDLSQFVYDVSWTPPLHETNTRRIKYDLEKAVSRQSTFFYQVSRPYMMEEIFLMAGEQRYKAYLHLFKCTDCRIFLVPTYDIDLLWHAHQLNPKLYSEDLTRILGRVLEHDDSDTDRGSGHKLDEGFRQTSEEWLRCYGRVYEQAGAMYRGEPSASVTSHCQLPAVGTTPSFVSIPREIMQVSLTVLRARNLPEKGGALYVQLRLHKKSSAFKLKTPSVSFSSEATWTHTWRVQAEKSTEGFELELLRRHSSRTIEKLMGSEALGHISMSWQSLLSTSNLSFTGWLSLTPSQAYGPSLYVSVSVTPPYLGPQMFRIINSIPTDDDGRMGKGNFFDRRGCWLTRTVLDHANRQVFIIRSRYSDGHTHTPDSQKCIYIHEGGWVYRNGHSKKGTASANVIAIANQIITGKESKDILSSQRCWSFMESSSLIVRASKEDLKWNLRPHLELCGSLKDEVELVCGRKLAYEIKGASEDDEGGFVTVIRKGKATALFNWRTGAMEVLPEESAVLVVLLSSIISMSVVEIEGIKVKVSDRRQPPSRSSKIFEEWGSAVTNELSAILQDGESKTVCNSWWEMSGIDWSSAFYTPDNPMFGASGCGAAGACGGGACGGSACGGTGCGGAAGSGCGGGGGGGDGGGGGGGGGCGGGGGGGCS